MQVRFIGRGIKGFVAVADQALYWGMICKSAEERYKILNFWDRFGWQATQEAFGVSHRTLFAWRAQLRRGQGRPHALAPRSTRPKHLRKRLWPAPLIDRIRALRLAHPNLGKEKLHVLLKRFCSENRLRLPSVRTIGRLIADAPDKMRHAPVRASRFHQGRVQRQPRQRKPKGYRATSPGECIAWDSIERRRDGLRRYLLTSTDLASRFAFALGVNALSSARASLACRLQQLLFPLPAQHVLSDNGHEFAKHFDRALQAQAIPHWHTFPRTPKMNAHCERFNRTIQEEFVDYHEELLFYDLAAFNDRLLHWLTWYNLERPHHSLALKAPVDILSKSLQRQCRMYWPSTLP